MSVEDIRARHMGCGVGDKDCDVPELLAKLDAVMPFIRERADTHRVGENTMTEEWRQQKCQGCQAESLLAILKDKEE